MRLSRYLVPILLLSSSSAFAFDLGVVAGINRSQPSLTSSGQSGSYDAGTGLSFGGYMGFSMIPMVLGLDVGAQYTQTKYSTLIGGAGGIPLSDSYAMIQVPVIARLQMIPFISPGLGLYFGYGMGSISRTTGAIPSSPSFEQANLSVMDIGAVASVRANFPLMPLMDLVADARYMLPLKNQAASAANTFKVSSMQFLAGVQLGF